MQRHTSLAERHPGVGAAFRITLSCHVGWGRCLWVIVAGLAVDPNVCSIDNIDSTVRIRVAVVTGGFGAVERRLQGRDVPFVDHAVFFLEETGFLLECLLDCHRLGRPSRRRDRACAESVPDIEFNSGPKKGRHHGEGRHHGDRWKWIRAELGQHSPKKKVEERTAYLDIGGG